MINIFISYTLHDLKWKDVLISQIKNLGENNQFSILEIGHLDGEEVATQAIHAALKEADAAVLLITVDYFNSSFLINKEIPLILERNETGGLKIFPVLVEPCPWEMVPWLSKLQVYPGNGKPLASLDNYQLENTLAKLIDKLKNLPSSFKLEPTSMTDSEQHMGENNSCVYKVTITSRGEENFFEIGWTNLQTKTTDRFMQRAPDIIRQLELWRQNETEALNIGGELYRFLNGDSHLLDRALGIAEEQYNPLLLLLTTGKETADWPFELLAKEKEFLLMNKLHLLRFVPGWTENKIAKPANRPLKLLFMACSPVDVTPELYFEKEEETIVRIADMFALDMQVEDSGSLEGLENQLLQSKYDVIHLSGYYSIDKEGQPYFVMENESGLAQKVYAGELWDKTLKNNPPRLLFLAGNITRETPTKDAAVCFAQKLLENYNAPAVLVWSRPVGEWVAYEAVKMIYKELSRGKTVLDALRRARQELLRENVPMALYAPWALLHLYGSSSILNALVLEGQTVANNPRRMKHIYLTHGNVNVLPEGFVGRRREMQYCIKALNWDFDKVGLLLIGAAGLGKSCLAGKICERFPAHTLIVVHGKLNAITLELALKDAFIISRDDTGNKVLNTPQSMTEKLATLCSTSFKEKNYLLLLDDFEQNLEGAEKGEPGALLPETVAMLEILLNYLPFSGKMTQLIITSRYVFSIWRQEKDLVSERLEFVYLTGLGKADQWKKAQRLEHIMAYQATDTAVVKQLVAMGCGNPRLMEWIDQLVGLMPNTEIPGLIAAVKDKRTEFIHSHVLRELALRASREED